MGSARKILDQYFDILIFVLGVVWVSMIFMRVSQIQTQQFENITGSQNNLIYIEAIHGNGVYGSSLISFLLGDDVVPVQFDGTTYSSLERDILIERIENTSLYTLTRVYGDDMDFPTMLVVKKVVGG